MLPNYPPVTLVLLAGSLLTITMSASAFADDFVRIQLPAEPATLDPYLVHDVGGFNIICNVMSGLLRMDGKGNLQKALAKSYKVSRDGLQYRFTLQKDARWSDGKNVVAADFIRGLQHALDAKTAATDASMLFAIKGAKAFYAGKTNAEALGLRQEGKDLIIELERPDPAFLQILTMPLAGPLSQEALKSGRWDYRQAVTGSYTIQSIKPGQQIELKPNPFHKQVGQRPVLFQIIPEEVTALNLFESGRMDIIASLTNTEIKRMREKGFIRDAASAVTYFLAFNLSKAPFDNPIWRKALASAIDRQEIAKLLNGAYRATTSYLPRAIDGYREFSLQFSKELAKVKLETKGVAISLSFASSANANLILQKVQNDLERNLGWQVSLRPMEWKAYLNELNGNTLSVFYLGFSAPFNDPLSHLKALQEGEANNRYHYANAKYQALVEKIKITATGAKRIQMIQEAQRILLEQDTVIIPILERVELWGVAKKIQNFQLSPYGVMQLHLLR